MSEHIKQVFRDRFEQYLENEPPADGQLLAARFSDRARADQLAEAVAELTEGKRVTLTLREDHNELPAIRIGETTLYVVRVVDDLPTDRTQTQVTEGFGTGLRNHVLDGSVGDRNAAALLILDSSTDIDTLNAAEFLTDNGQPLNPGQVRADLLDWGAADSVPACVVLRAVDTYLREDLGSTEDDALLDEIAHVRAAVDEEDLKELGRAIGSLPEMLRFDHLVSGFFTSGLDEDRAYEQFLGGLRTANDHARILTNAFGPGKNTKELLRQEYNESFVSEYSEEANWTSIPFSAVREGTREIPEPTGDGEDDDGTIFEPPKGSETDDEMSTVPSYDGYSISPSEHVSNDWVQSDFTRAGRRDVLRCPMPEGPIELELDFDGPLDNVDLVCTPSVGDGVSVEGSKIEFTLDVDEDDSVQWRRVEVWIGRTDRRGYPTVQIDVVLLPDWWYHTLGDTDFDIRWDDDSQNQLVIHDQGSFDLTPPGSSNENETEVTVGDPDQIVTVGRRTTVYIDLEIDGGESAELPFVLTPGAGTSTEARVPILAYDDDPEISTLDVRLPLALDAIVEPERWRHQNLQLKSSSVSDGKIQAGGKLFVPSDADLRTIVKIEGEFIDAETPAPRTVDDVALAPDTEISEELSLPQPLRDAYDRLFEHFTERETTPSTDRWDAETIRVVRRVVDAYVDIDIDSSIGRELSDVRKLGVLETTGETTKQWVTSFHPLMLAYGIRLVDWRDGVLVDGGLVEGFDDDHLASHLTPTGLLPYRSRGADDTPRPGRAIPGHALWLSYPPADTYESDTLGFMRNLIAEKVESFYDTFRPLFELHEDRPLTINFLNMGSLDECLLGLLDVVDTLAGSGDGVPRGSCPSIELRVYGGGDQGRALHRLFGSESDRTKLFEDVDPSAESIDKLQSKLTYTFPDNNDRLQDAHLSFFRNVLNPKFSALTLDDLPDRLLRDGLLPRESHRVEGTSDGRSYTNGFSCGESRTKQIHTVARRANRIEQGHRNNEEYGPESKIARVVRSERGDRFAEILDRSSWATHVEPPVGLEFYTDTPTDDRDNRTDGDAPLVIHYDDTRQQSFGYDVITTTNRQGLYVDALETELQQIDRHETTSPERVLDVLAAIDGNAVTELQGAPSNRVKELIGMAGAFVLERQILRRYFSDHAWVAVNIADEVQHDRERHNPRPGVLPFAEDGRASDDFMFVGIPKRASGDALRIKLWFTEAKGGTASAASGVGQVNETIDRVERKFDPERRIADTELLRSAVGRLTTDVAARLGNYSLLDDEELDIVASHKDELLNGEFRVDFLRDRRGARGSATNVGGSEIDIDFEYHGGIRTVTVPVNVFKLVPGDGEETDLDEYFDPIDVDEQIGFES